MKLNKLALKLKTFFIGREDVYAVQTKDGGYFPSKQSLHLKDFEDHLNGKKTIGIYLITPKINTVNFCALDIDNYDDELLHQIIFSCRKIGLSDEQILLEHSGNKGRHIFFRFEESILAKEARKLLTIILKYAEIDVEIELFPKQDKIKTNKYGNLIKLPLGIHNKSNKRSYFMDLKSFKPIKPEIIHEIKFINKEKLNDIFTEFNYLLPKINKTQLNKSHNNENIEIIDNYKCIKNILNGVEEGYRDICLFNLCIYLLKIKKLPENIALETLINWNKRNSPPLNEKNIDLKIKHILSGDYTNISCSDPLIKHFCDTSCPQDIKKESAKSIKQKTGFLITDNEIIESIYSKEKGSIFVIYNRNNQTLSYKSQFQHNGTLYMPFSDDLIMSRTVLLPSDVGNYQSLGHLILEIKKFIYKYVELPEEFENLCAYYVVFSYIADCFDACPYIRFKGDYNSGKSRALKVIGSICYKATICGGATTTSPIFRLIDQIQGTLVLDEADFKNSEASDDIMKILNAGYAKGTPVLRTEKGQNYFVKAFNCYSPKIIATRRSWRDQALESRCITIEMSGKKRSDIPYNIHQNTFDYETLQIRNKLLMFRFKNYKNYIVDESEADHSLEPRINQIMLPLLNIIEDWRAKNDLKKMMKDLNQRLIEDRGLSLPCDIFRIILELWNPDSPSLKLKDIANKFNEQNKDSEKPLTSRKVGYLVKEELQIRKQRFNDGVYIFPTYEQLNKLKKKYGISEGVNVVKVA